MNSETILIIGANGQLGTDLTQRLREIHGTTNVFKADLRDKLSNDGPEYIQLNVLDFDKLEAVVKEYKITTVYLLAAMLSGTAEKNPQAAWNLNMNSLLHLLKMARNGLFKKLFFPSSIAIFGDSTPKIKTPQTTIAEPTTVYGISKIAGEQWCQYYSSKFGVDVRGVRYPGLISSSAMPGGGTTDYAVEIFYEAIKNKHYTCFLKEDTALPMLYMPDAVEASIELMQADATKLSTAMCYNIGGLSFTPAEIYESIKRHIPTFTIDYEPDFRQAIANSWPSSLDYSLATKDWGYKPKYTLDEMVEDMLVAIEKRLSNDTTTA